MSARPNPLIICDGQSFNYTPFAALPGDPVEASGAAPTFPKILASLLPGMAVFVVGLSGTTYATRATSVSSRVYPLLGLGPLTVIHDLGGPSDLLADLTAAQVLAASEGYADAARAAGAHRILTATVTPALNYSGAQNAQRVAYNALLRANANGKFDGIVDIDGIPQLANPNDAAQYLDGLHPTYTGTVPMATLAATRIKEHL